MMKEESSKKQKRERRYGDTTIREKLAFGLGGIGYQMTLAMTNAFLVLYYTDSVLLAAAFIGGMMLIARLLDGATDLLVGYIIERTKTRWGKARPWLLISAPFLAVSMILMFNVPTGLSETATNVYVFVTYVFMTAICYTFSNLAHYSMLPRISLSSEDRNRLTTILALMMGIMTALLAGIFVPVLEALGGESSQQAWTIISIGIAVISMILLLVCFLAVKEKLSAFDQPDQKKNAAASKGKSTVKESLTFLLKSKYFYIIVFLYLTMALTNGSAGINIYFMRDVLGDANLLGIFSLVNALAMILMMPFVPKLFSALGKRKTLIIGLALTSLAGIVRLMFPTVLIMQLVTSFFTTFFIVPLWIASPTMICDLVDYGDWRRGIRTEGFTTSASSFGNKLGTGLGSLLLGVGLSLGGYDGLAATQSPQSINAIILIMIGLPLLLSLLCLAGILIWDLDKTLPQVEAYMNEKKAKEAGQENNAQSSS